jgi:hypothetical protein
MERIKKSKLYKDAKQALNSIYISRVAVLDKDLDEVLFESKSTGHYST